METPNLPYDPAANEFPKWRYHDTEAARIVNGPEHEQAETPDSDGWRNTPKAAEAPAPAEKPAKKAKAEAPKA